MASELKLITLKYTYKKEDYLLKTKKPLSFDKGFRTEDGNWLRRVPYQHLEKSQS